MADAPTLQDLLATQAATAKALAPFVVQSLTDTKTALADPALDAVVAKLQACQASLPDGNAKIQIGNVLQVLVVVPPILDQELAAATALAAT